METINHPGEVDTVKAQQEEQKVAFDLLKRYGVRWAVLAAMRVDMARKGIAISEELDDDLKFCHLKISSGCFSPCDVGDSLSRVEAKLTSLCHLLEPESFREWSNLLAQAMQGQIDPRRIGEIPALKPVESDCAFLACGCS